MLIAITVCNQTISLSNTLLIIALKIYPQITIVQMVYFSMGLFVKNVHQIVYPALNRDQNAINANLL
jgi:hypothetical protein